MKCVGVEQDGSKCFRETTRKQGPFWACEVHGALNWNYIRMFTRDKLIHQMVENGNISSHTFGITYFVYLPNGNIKIGFSRDEVTLADRVKKLGSQFNGTALLVATAYGGESLEAYYHWKFREDRLSGLYLEQFHASTQIVQEIRKLRMVPKGKLALNILDQHEIISFSPGARSSMTGTEQRRANVQKVQCPKCHAPRGVPCVDTNGDARESNHSERAKLYSEKRDELVARPGPPWKYK